MKTNGKAAAEIRNLAASYSEEAVECLRSVMLNTNASPDAKVGAATTILNVAGMIVDIIEER